MMKPMMLLMLMMMLLMSRMKTCLRYNGMPHLVFGSHMKYRSAYMCMVHQIYILIGGWGDHIVKFISCIAANEHEIWFSDKRKILFPAEGNIAFSDDEIFCTSNIFQTTHLVSIQMFSLKTMIQNNIYDNVLDDRGDQGEMWFLSSIAQFPLLMKPGSTRRGNLPLKTMEHCEGGDQDEMWFPHWMAQYPLLSPLIRADCCGLWRRIGRSFFAATFTFTFISPLTFTFSITIFIYVRVQEVCTYMYNCTNLLKFSEVCMDTHNTLEILVRVHRISGS